MVFQNHSDLRPQTPVMSVESVGSPASPRSNNSRLKYLSDLKTKSSKRSEAYSQDQVKQLIELFPEISHLKRRAETENLEELFPDALAELVEILGSTKAVEQELFRRKATKDKEARKAAEREVRKTTGVRFASSTTKDAVFECLESEALRRAGIAEQALANATAARDKVHKLYSGLISTTNPICHNNDDSSTISSLALLSESTSRPQETPKQPSTTQLHASSQNEKEPSQQGIRPGNLSLERWESLRKEARVIITRRLLVGWKMSSESCKGSQCRKCPLIEKQNKQQCVICGGTGSGQDGLYGYSGNRDGQGQKKESDHQTPPAIHEMPTPVTMDSQDTPSNILGRVAKKIERNQHQVSEAAKAVAKSPPIPEEENEYEPDEFENLLAQQRSPQRQGSPVIVYDISKEEDSSTTASVKARVQKLNSDAKKNASSATRSGGKGLTKTETSSSDANKRQRGEEVLEEVCSRARETIISGRIQLDGKEKQDIMDEVQSIISRSVAASQNTNAKRSRVAQQILLKTAQGWSLIDASCNKCEMPLLTDPTGTEELCVFCEVKKEEKGPFIHLDKHRSTPSEITDTVYGRTDAGERSHQQSLKAEKIPPTSVTIVRPGSGSFQEYEMIDSRQPANERSQSDANYSEDQSPGSQRDSHPRQDQDRRGPGNYERASNMHNHDRAINMHPSVASPGFDPRSNFPLQNNNSYDETECDETAEVNPPEIQSVLSPDFNDRDMFPFLVQNRQSRQGLESGTSLPYLHRRGQSNSDPDNPLRLGILPDAAGPRSQWPGHFEGMQQPRRSPAERHDGREHDITRTMQTGQRIYDQVRGRMQNNANSGTSISSFDIPYAQHNGHFNEESAPAANGVNGAQSHHTRTQNSESWRLPPAQGYGADRRNYLGELQHDESVDSDYDERELNECQHHGIASKMSEEMRIRVTENIKAGRINGYNMNKKVKTESASDDSDFGTGNPQILPEPSLSSPRKAAKRLHDAMSSKLNDLQDSFGSYIGGSQANQQPHSQETITNFYEQQQARGPQSPKTSTNFYEQLKERDQYSSWAAAQAQQASLQSNGGNAFEVEQNLMENQKSGISFNNHGSGSQHAMNVLYAQPKPAPAAAGVAKPNFSMAQSKTSSTESKSSLSWQSQGLARRDSSNQSFPTHMSLASTKGPLPSVQEAPNEISPNTSSFSHQSKSLEAISPARMAPKDLSLEATTSSSPAMIKAQKDNMSLVSSLGVPGMDDSNDQKAAAGGMSRVEANIKSRTRSLVDEEYSSSCTKTGSSSSRESNSDEGLLSAIRMPKQTEGISFQEGRCDPPDAPLHVVARNSRAGRDPEGEAREPSKTVQSPKSIIMGGAEKPQPKDESGTSRVFQKKEGFGGFAIMIPEGFDFNDEAALRNLFLSAQQQKLQSSSTRTRQPPPLDTSNPSSLDQVSSYGSSLWSPLSASTSKSKSPSRLRRNSNLGTFGSQSPSSKNCQATLPSLFSSKTNSQDWEAGVSTKSGHSTESSPRPKRRLGSPSNEEMSRFASNMSQQQGFSTNLNGMKFNAAPRIAKATNGVSNSEERSYQKNHVGTSEAGTIQARNTWNDDEKSVQIVDVKVEEKTRSTDLNSNESTSKDRKNPLGSKDGIKPHDDQGRSSLSSNDFGSLIDTIRGGASTARSIEISRGSDPPECASVVSPRRTARKGQDPDVDESKASKLGSTIGSYHRRLIISQQQRHETECEEPPSVHGGRKVLDPEESGTRQSREVKKVDSLSGPTQPSSAEGPPTKLEPKDADDDESDTQKDSASDSSHHRRRRRASAERKPDASATEESEDYQHDENISRSRQATRGEQKRAKENKHSSRHVPLDCSPQETVERNQTDPATSRNRKCPRPESSKRRQRKSNKDTDEGRPGKNGPAEEDSYMTPTLEPRVQSPYFDGISALEDPVTEGPMRPPQFKARSRRRGSWASGASQRSDPSGEMNRRMPSVGEEHEPPPRNSFRGGEDSSHQRFSIDPSQHKYRSRVPSLGEQEPSLKNSIAYTCSRTGTFGGFESLRTRELEPLDMKRRPSGAKAPLKTATSSISSWASEPSQSDQKSSRKLRVGATGLASKRIGDTLKFGSSKDARSVSSSSSSISSWSTRRKPMPPKEEAPPRPKATTKAGTIEGYGVSKKKLQSRPSDSFESSSSSFTTNQERLTASNGVAWHPARSEDEEDDDLFFVGGPLNRNRRTRPSLPPASPDSIGSDSTPFEDILNRCKTKLEQISLPDDHTERASLPEKYMSFDSRSSNIIDLVDASEVRSTRTSRSARSRRSTRSADRKSVV